jgi:hypothetical protein
MTVKGQVDTIIQCYFNVEKSESYNNDCIFPIFSLMFTVYLTMLMSLVSTPMLSR